MMEHGNGKILLVDNMNSWCSTDQLKRGGLSWKKLRICGFSIFFNESTGVYRPWKKGDENWRDESWFRMFANSSKWPFAIAGLYVGPEKCYKKNNIGNLFYWNCDGLLWTLIGKLCEIFKYFRLSNEGTIFLDV